MDNKKLEINDSLNTPFFKALIADEQFITSDIRKRQGFDIEKNNHHLLTSKEKKTVRVFLHITNLISTLDDIKLVYAFINRKPAKSYLDKHDISELKYIRFHIEVFFHKVHTVGEIMKLIANEVLDVNLPLKECSWSSLVKKKSFNSAPCKKIIERFYNNFKTLIENRHLNSHRGIYEDEKMDDISMTYETYRFSEKYEFEIDEEYRQAFPKYIVKYQVKKFKNAKLDEVALYEQIILEHIYQFLNSLTWPSKVD